MFHNFHNLIVYITLSSLVTAGVEAGFISPPLVVARQNWTSFGPTFEALISVPEKHVAATFPDVPILRRTWLSYGLLDTHLLSELNSGAPAALVIQKYDRALSMIKDSPRSVDMSGLFRKYRLNETLPKSLIASTIRTKIDADEKVEGDTAQHTLLPIMGSALGYTCDKKKLIELGLRPEGPSSGSQLEDIFRRAAGAGYIPVLLSQTENPIQFASSLFVSMYGTEFAFEFARGHIPFDDSRLSSWYEKLGFWHSQGWIRRGWDELAFSAFTTSLAVCTFASTGLANSLGLSDEEATVFLPPAWGNTGNDIHGTVNFYSMALLRDADFADKAFAAVDSYIAKLQTRPFENHGISNFFILPQDAKVLQDRGLLYELDAATPGLEVLFVPELAEIIMAAFDENLFRVSVEGDYSSEPRNIDLDEVAKLLDARRVELILSRASEPVPSVPSGSYDKPFTVSLTSKTVGAEIRFTFDQSDPRSGIVASGPIAITSGDTLIRAIALTEGLNPSKEITLTYSVPLPVKYAAIFGGTASIIGIAIIAAIVVYRLRRGKEVPDIPPQELCFEEMIAFGARGVVYRATWRGTPVAVKLYLSREYRQLALSGKLLVDTTAMTSAHVNQDASGSPSQTRSFQMGGSANFSTANPIRTPTDSTRSNVYAMNMSASGARRLWQGIIKELKTIAAIRNPHIVSVFGTVDLGKGRRGVVMELMEHGSLFDTLGNAAVDLGPRRRLEIALGTARGLSTLHSQRPCPVIHRDFKSLNVLIGAGFEPKVSDFDLAVRCPKGSRDARFTRSTSAIGTVAWAAPEVLACDGMRHSTAADVYSYAVVLWEILSGKEPYADHGFTTHDEIAAFVRSGKRLAVPKTINPDVAQLIAECWAHNPDARPNIEEIVGRLSLILADAPPDPETSGGSAQSLVCARAVVGDDKVHELQKAILAGSFPPPIAVSSASVIFTDIVGFTALSSNLDPVKVASMLTRLFSAFDASLAARGGMQYKTVGDCYIAIVPAEIIGSRSFTIHPMKNVNSPSTPSIPAASQSHESGVLPGERNGGGGEVYEGSHGVRAVQLALDFVFAAAQTAIDPDDKTFGTLSIRAGVHSGPLALQMMEISGVEFLGDTMNFASRLETSSEPGRVHISSDVADAVKHESVPSRTIALLPRTGVHLKGKGEMRTYFASASGATQRSKIDHNGDIDITPIPGQARLDI